MKYISKNFLVICIALIAFVSCKKVADLPFYNASSGSVSEVLSVSSSTIAATPADSDKVVLTVSWSNPKYATDSTKNKYVIEIDSANKNFANAASKIIIGTSSTTFTAKDLNTILLSRNYAFNVPVDMEMRLISSYGNNNDRIISNTVKLKITPYLIPPKVTPPASGKLFLVGDASQGGWNNPVPVPTQEFAKLDSVTYAGVFNLVGGKQYLVLPVNGDWSHKYSVADNSIAGLSAGGDFGYDLSSNFPGPATSGNYTITINFQSGKFTVTPYTGTLPTNLFIVGDATSGGWNNPVPVPSQQLTRLNSAVWQITIPLIGGKQYLLLPVNGDWGHKYAVADNSIAGLSAGGSFGYDLNSNFPGPAASGTYKITVNFVTMKFTVQ